MSTKKALDMENCEIEKEDSSCRDAGFKNIPMELVKKEISKYRGLLSLITKAMPKVMILEECNSDGETIFAISMEDMGLSVTDYVHYKPEIFSNYIVDTIGELIVRENIDAFSKILTKMDAQNYPNVIGQYEHKRFGLRILKNNFIFRFHVSLLQSILTEDLKKEFR